jgi:hypothetical protein
MSEKKESQLFILVLVNTKKKESLGVEFCADVDELNFKKRMFLKDFGSDYVALTYLDFGDDDD